MKFRSIGVALLALTWSTLAANAAPITGQISVDGYAEAVGSIGMGSATGIDFASGAGESVSGTSGDLYSFGAGSDSFAGLTCSSAPGGCGTIMDIASFASEPATTSFLTITTGGPAVSFDLSSITSVSHVPGADGGSVTFTADGTINYTGYDSTAGKFILTAEGNGVVSYSATLLAEGTAPAPAPEPSSLVLLGGPMLLGAFQQFRRKGRI
jgi:hypothetical protein